MVSKKKALEIIDNEICQKCGDSNLTYAILTNEDTNGMGKRLRRTCESCGNVIEFILNE